MRNSAAKRTVSLRNSVRVKSAKLDEKFAIDDMPWKSFDCLKTQLRLDIVLKCGQSFRWSERENSKSRQWIGVLRDKVWILSQDDNKVFYKTLKGNTLPSTSCVEDDHELQDYFQLKVDLASLYESWMKVDPFFRQVSLNYPGVRILRQDPVENLFSFICSANNNIRRISGMVENLCKHFGEPITTVDDTIYYSFPSLEALSETSVERKLRTLGFGYRAAYIVKSAQQLVRAGGIDYLESLRSKPYKDAKMELLKLSGIGPKVADCVLLMSLDQPSSIPVDTHMFQIASKKYLPHLKSYKSVTDKVYSEVGDHFRGLYGDYAGWAHSVLFSADLKHLKHLDDEAKMNNQ